jgi:AbrB family looped-hinge helix DNA binding protein
LQFSSIRIILLLLIDIVLVRKMAATATLSTKFQISIPKAVRESQGWEPGQKFAFVPKGKGFVLVPVPRANELFGSAAGADPTGYRDREEPLS